MNSIKYLFVLAAFGFTFSSCTKQEAGPTGPQGPQGSQGPSSNFYTVVDSVSTAQWISVSAINAYKYTFTPINNLTSPNTSDVDVYLSQTYSPTNGAYAQWFDLPVSNALVSGDNFDFSYNTYNLTIWYTNSAAPANAYLYFKIVIITNPQ
jgi:hypothetical protein